MSRHATIRLHATLHRTLAHRKDKDELHANTHRGQWSRETVATQQKVGKRREGANRRRNAPAKIVVREQESLHHCR